MVKEFKYKGFTFYSEEDLLAAKKENETIEYIKAKTNLSNTSTMLALYNKMIDRRMITTVIGLSFLTELRETILKDNIVSEDSLKPLPEIKATPRKEAEKKIKAEKAKKKDDGNQANSLKAQNTILKVIVAGLVVIIIGMFVIVLTGKSSPARRVYEQQIIDKYSSWKESLDEQQQWINKQMDFLEENGIYFDK